MLSARQHHLCTQMRVCVYAFSDAGEPSHTSLSKPLALEDIEARMPHVLTCKFHQDVNVSDHHADSSVAGLQSDLVVVA